MKLDKGQMTDFLSLPAEEAEKTIEAMKLAEQTNDIEGLKWCARRIVWLCEGAGHERGDDEAYPARLFNKAWADLSKNDPPPESIASIIAKIDQGTSEETAAISNRAEAQAALEEVMETIETLVFEDNKKYLIEPLAAVKNAIAKGVI